ncbi:MAG: hypothetical protein V2J62_13170 [candidate division KSB1 bacterium]|nr:hypothetical protein [candidate division KSB1 bacterium]
MALRNKVFVTNLAVGILGLVVGVDNLSRWLYDGASMRHLIIGMICTACALGWLLYVFFSSKNNNSN